MKLEKVDPTCRLCGGCHGFDFVKLPGGGPYSARCKGCGGHNDPCDLGYHTDDVGDPARYEERAVAKTKEKSRAEILAEQVKAGSVKRSPKRAPSYVFPGNGLRSRRKKLELKQSMVSEECSVDAGVLSSIERGSDPRLSTALRLAAFYGVSVEQLFGSAVLVDGSGPLEVNREPAKNADAPPPTEDLPFDGEDDPNADAA